MLVTYKVMQYKKVYSFVEELNKIISIKEETQDFIMLMETSNKRIKSEFIVIDDIKFKVEDEVYYPSTDSIIYILSEVDGEKYTIEDAESLKIAEKKKRIYDIVDDLCCCYYKFCDVLVNGEESAINYDLMEVPYEIYNTLGLGFKNKRLVKVSNCSASENKCKEILEDFNYLCGSFNNFYIYELLMMKYWGEIGESKTFYLPCGTKNKKKSEIKEKINKVFGAENIKTSLFGSKFTYFTPVKYVVEGMSFKEVTKIINYNIREIDKIKKLDTFWKRLKWLIIGKNI